MAWINKYIVQQTGQATDKVMSQKAVTDSLGEKVDVVSGKALSANDYTTNEKNKLSGISSGAQVNPTVDNVPTDGSGNLVSSGGAYTAIANLDNAVDSINSAISTIIGD